MALILKISSRPILKIKEIISTQLRYPTISTCKDVLKENLPLTNYRQLDYDVESINHK